MRKKKHNLGLYDDLWMWVSLQVGRSLLLPPSGEPPFNSATNKRPLSDHHCCEFVRQSQSLACTINQPSLVLCLSPFSPTWVHGSVQAEVKVLAALGTVRTLFSWAFLQLLSGVTVAVSLFVNRGTTMLSTKSAFTFCGWCTHTSLIWPWTRYRQFDHHQKAQVTSTLCIYLEKCALIYKASLVAGTAAHCKVVQCNAMHKSGFAMQCRFLQSALLYC